MSEESELKFCSACGAPLEIKIPEGDTRQRHVCTKCGQIHYENPHNIVGTVPVYDGKVLLCRRAIDPCFGKWNLPAGHQEMKEGTMAGALRETKEEAGAELTNVRPFMLLDVPFASGTHIYFIGDVVNPDCKPGPETLEQRFFSEEEIPWDKIAFNSVKRALKCYFSDLEKGSIGFHYEIKEKPGKE